MEEQEVLWRVGYGCSFDTKMCLTRSLTWSTDNHKLTRLQLLYNPDLRFILYPRPHFVSWTQVLSLRYNVKTVIFYSSLGSVYLRLPEPNPFTF